jgi:hypothetical protein
MKLSRPQNEIIVSSQKINLFLAGMGSGKTYLAGVLSYTFVQKFPNVKGFIGTNTYDQLNTSTLYRVKAVWESFGVIEGVHYVCGKKPPSTFNTDNHFFDSYNNIISWCNGAVIFQGSLENAKAHEGKEFGWAILDETKDTDEDDVKEVILMRLREQGMFVNGKPWNPLFILTSPAKVRWINNWFKLDLYEKEIKSLVYSKDKFFVKRFDNKKVVISSTHHNLANLPQNYIEDKKFDLSDEQFNMMIYADPFMKTGGEFYSSFDRTIHVGKVMPVMGLPIHVTLDQNVVPYYTCLIFQVELIGDRYNVRQLAEICAVNPYNKTERVAGMLEDMYGEYMREGGFYYYGDATGKNRDTRGETDYEIWETRLARYIDGNTNRVLRVNPSVKKRRDFINKIFEGKLPIDVIFDEKCTETIADFEYIKELPDGSKHKEIVRDEKKGVSYQKVGHTSDAFDYFMVSCFKSFFKD